MNQNHAHNMNNKDLAPWGAIMVLCSLAFVWFVGHTKISMFVLWVRWLEAHMMVFDPDGKAALSRWLGTTTAADTTLAGIFSSGAVAGYSLRWFSLALLIVWFAWLIKKSGGRTGRYAHRYTMESLAVQEAAQWPVVTPILGLNLPEVPLEDPINGMRQDGRQWCRRHKLLLPRWAPPADVEKLQGAVQLEDGRWIDAPRARSAFAHQLGKPWQGVDALLPYERALFAAFAAQLGNDQKLALKIIDELALAAPEAFTKRRVDLLDAASAAGALAMHGTNPGLQKLVNAHYYQRTVLMEVLAGCRANGVLAPGWFRWLKMANRTTWYALNDLGLGVASVEAAGIRAHYQAEVLARTAIKEPMIEPALNGLIEYLNTYLDVETEN